MDPMAPVAVLKLLAAMPRRIAALTEGIDGPRLRRKPDANTWSANEILGHLRACADIWGGYIAASLTKEEPRLRYTSPRTWIRKTNYMDLDFGTSFQAYATQRSALLKLLRAMPSQHWQKRASIKGAPKSLDTSVLGLAQGMAQHEAGHCEQIERILRPHSAAPD